VDPGAPLTPGSLLAGRTSGEVVLVSRWTSHGYLGAPDATAARFTRLPDGRTACRTGDLGRLGPDGALVVLGRADDQVKINGVRVHPAEVTRALRDRPEVADVFVTAGGDPPRLTAHVVPAAGPLDVPALRGALTRRLPLAMVPSRFVEVAELPRARTGKVDRAALVAAAPAPATAGAAALPGTESWVAAAVAELLGVPAPGRDDDLLALGADSLVVGSLAARVARDHGVAVTPRELFGAATVAGIAAALDAAALDAAGTAGTGRAVAAIPVLDRSAGVLPTGAAQRSLYFLQQLRPDSPAYNTVEALRLRGPVDPGAWRAALAAVLARHEVLRTTVRLDDDGPVLVPAPALVAGAHVPVHRAAPGDGEALLARLAARPFDLDAELPVRLDLVRVAEREHLLLLVTHHIAADAWSCRLLVAELLAAHDAAGAAGPPPAVQYADVVAAREAAYDPAPDAAYWRQRLAGAPPLLELPRDTPRPAAPGQPPPATPTCCTPTCGPAWASRRKTRRGAALLRTSAWIRR